MADTWLTIEQAAVTLDLSVRTINRHINAGKLQSRLHEGRREVLVSLPTPRRTRAVGDERVNELRSGQTGRTGPISGRTGPSP